MGSIFPVPNWSVFEKLSRIAGFPLPPLQMSSNLKDAAKHIKMVDDLIHRQHQTMRHLQRSIDSIDYKSRLIKRMDLELAALESKQSAKGVLTLDDKPS